MRIAGFSEEEIDNADITDLLAMQKAMSSQFDLLGRYLMLHAEYTVLLSNRPKRNDPLYNNALKATQEKLLGVYNPVLTEQKHKQIIELGDELYARYQKRKGIT